MRRYGPFLAMLVCGVLLAATRATEPFDLKLLDSQFKLLRAWSPQTVAKDVVVVGIDEDTAKRFPEPLTLWHAHFGRFFSAMALAKPAAIGVDIILPERSYESVLPGSDKKLLKGLLDARLSFPLVLGETVDPLGKPRAIFPLFLKIAGASGYALFPVDRDGVVRRFDERLADGGNAVPTLAGEMARKLGKEPGAGYIDFRRGAPFHYIPLHQVLQWADSGDKDALVRAFRDKPVLVGMALPFEDSGFKGLVEYSLPVFWGFFLLVGVALFVLRAKEPNAPRPFRVPGYPVVPAIFVLMCAYLLYSSLAYHGKHALWGLAVLALGAVVMRIDQYKNR